VRPHIAWYFRWGMMLPFVLAALALVWFAYNSGLEFAGFHRGETQRELEELHGRVAKLTEENAQLNSKVLKLQQEVQIEQGGSQESSRQLKGMTEENTRLQEDLSFFQNLTATRGKEGELSILRMSLERDKIPGEYRVRMLLAQSGQRVKEFNGGYQLVATYLLNGRKVTQQFPSEQSGHGQFSLNFKYYQNLEQNIRFPADAQLQNVQVRLFKQDAREPSVRQSVNLS
jgi:cell division protein FtsB